MQRHISCLGQKLEKTIWTYRIIGHYIVAWFVAANSANTAALTANNAGAVEVGSNTYTVGDLSVRLKVSAISSTMTGMGLAHFSEKEAGEVANDDKAKKPYLTTGYRDQGGTFHDLGYDASGDPVLTGFTTSTTKLTNTLTVSIQVDWTLDYSAGVSGGWVDSSGDDVDTSAATHFKDSSGNMYTKAYVLGIIGGKSVTVGVKPSTGSRIRFIDDEAEDGNPNIASGLTLCNSDTYAQIAASQSLGELDTEKTPTPGSGTVTTTTINYYIFGGAASVNDTDDVSSSVDVWISEGA